jgi:hypothetical protein
MGFVVLGKRQRKVLEMVLNGHADANVAFPDLLNVQLVIIRDARLLRALGFSERIRGGHHIIWMAGVIEIINLQPRGQKAKPYQVRQVRKILLKYGLGANDD